MSRPQEDGIIRFGDHISLKHVFTGRYLTSRADQFYESGSNQQKVFTIEDYPGEDGTFIVIPPKVTEEEPGYEVGFEDEIRLKHVPTRANLHSHDIISPVSGQQEVSCFGNDEYSDEGDVWKVLQYDEDDEQYDDFWRVGQPVVLQHVATGKLLHSHDIALADGENEVTGFDGRDDNDKWAVSFD
ncbi:MIR motif-containing protein [Cokeromyces recurvatus]|uniref:MIR motif-containing protein n=1 Tax=Cokeromyces recurvatus TaxID=90255 RepID=UPI0022203FF0|nr:MIR motif-containing protein [Cokeromyces recurvatus]KAI7907936.1 MIR motif-containing protein [Cokeromyces recurvatus]